MRPGTDHSHGPVDEVQVEVVGPERLERLVKALLHSVVVRRPAAGQLGRVRIPALVGTDRAHLHLGSQEDLAAGHTAVLDTLSDLVLVLASAPPADVSASRQNYSPGSRALRQCACSQT